MTTIDEKLAHFINYEKKADTISTDYQLQSITTILDLLGRPQQSLPYIHVAGTNGKGSVCYMLQEALLAHGYTVGIYTSPHLEKVNERICYNASCITDQELEHYLDRINEVVVSTPHLHPTYFDILTIIAFLFFKDMSPDIIILETGLGGRLDSTNIVSPLLSVITDISFDHQHILGESLEEITAEKCGIIKPGIPVITSNKDEDVIKVVKKHAQEKNAPCHIYGREFMVSQIRPHGKGYVFNYQYKKTVIHNIMLDLCSKKQIDNYATAITVLLLLQEHGFTIDTKLIQTSVQHIIIPGRLQLLAKDPLILFDPAHNRDALLSLFTTLEECYSSKKIFIITSIMKDKHPLQLLQLMQKVAEGRICYIALETARCYIPEGKEIILIEENKAFHYIKETIEEHEEYLYIFTGTFQLYSLARSIGTDFAK